MCLLRVRSSPISVMASISGSQSGGKMVRHRRTARTRTPYDRPAPSQSQSQPHSPNWLSRFVISPTRFIASGAGKLLSSVLDLESSSAASSSSEISSPSSSSSYADSVAGNAYISIYLCTFFIMTFLYLQY